VSKWFHALCHRPCTQKFKDLAAANERTINAQQTEMSKLKDKVWALEATVKKFDKVRPGGCCSSHHRTPFDSIHEGVNDTALTWRAISGPGGYRSSRHRIPFKSTYEGVDDKIGPGVNFSSRRRGGAVGEG
jgi:hypothetical protein